MGGEREEQRAQAEVEELYACRDTPVADCAAELGCLEGESTPEEYDGDATHLDSDLRPDGPALGAEPGARVGEAQRSSERAERAQRTQWPGGLPDALVAQAIPCRKSIWYNSVCAKLTFW